MTNKIVSIKIVADSSGAGESVKKLAVEFDKLGASQKELSNIENKRQALLTEQVLAASRLQGTIEALNKSFLTTNTTIHLAKPAYEEYTKSIKQAEAALQSLANAQNLSINSANTKLAPGTGNTAKAATGFSFTSGASNTVAPAAPAAKVDSRTLERSVADIGFNLVSGATKAATIIKDAEKSLSDSVVSAAKVDARTITAKQAPSGFNYGTGAVTSVNKQAEAQDKVTSAIGRTQSALNGVVSTHKNLITHIGEVLVSYRALNTAINLVEQALLNIPKAGIALESTTASLTASFGSTTGAIKELEFLNAEAKRTGLSVQVLRESYQQAAASFIAAGESASTTREIFANLNTMSTTLHLNSDKTSSIYLALSQIFNKTKLQAEELTKQLSQTIPGVTNEQAKALGITVSELYDKMKKGAVSAHEAVLALSQTLARDYGGEAFKKASTGLNAELGRVQTSWTLLSENIYKVSSGAMTSVLKSTANVIDSLAKLFDNTKQVSDTFITLASTLGGALAGYAAVKAASLVLNSTLVTTVAQVGGLKLAWTNLGEVFSKNIFTGTIVALTTLGGYISSVQGKITSLREKAAELRADQAAADTTKPIEFRVENTKAVKDAKALVDSQREELRKLTDPTLGERVKNVFTFDIETTAGTKENIAKAKRDLGTFYDAYKKEIVKAQKDLAATEVKTQENIIPTIPKVEEPKEPKIPKVKSGVSAANKEATDYYKDLIRDSKLASQEVEASLKSMDKAYSNNVISIQDYFNKKKALQTQDIQQQIAANNKAIELASKRKDSAKIEEFTDKNDALVEKLRELTTVVDEDQTQAWLNLGDVLRKTALDYAELIGDAATVEKLAGPTQLIKDLDYLKTQLDSIDKNSSTGKALVAGIAQGEALKKEAALKTNISTAQKEFNKILDYTSAREKQIFEQQQQGFSTSEEALKQLAVLRGELADKAYQELLTIEASANKSQDLSLKLDAIIAKAKYNDTFGASSTAANAVASQSQGPAADITALGQATDNRETSLGAEKERNIQALRTNNLVSLEEFNKQKVAIEEKYSTLSYANQVGYYGGIASIAANSFESTYESMKAMYGAQSKEARRAFAAYKAAKLAEVTLSSIQAVMSAYANAGNPYLAPVMAGIAAAFGAVQIAQVASMQPPAAHGGLTNVPKEQTYLLDKGERVLSPNQNKDLTNFINSGSIGNQKSPEVKSNVRIINTVDPALMYDYLGSDEGERVIMNVVRRNKAA